MIYFQKVLDLSWERSKIAYVMNFLPSLKSVGGREAEDRLGGGAGVLWKIPVGLHERGGRIEVGRHDCLGKHAARS